MSEEGEMRWREPWFFSLRMRNRSGWRRKVWLILAIFVAMIVAWYLDQKYGKGLRIGFIGASVSSLCIAVFLGFLNDLVVTEVSITKEGIVLAIYGHGFGVSRWRYSEISQFALLLPKDSGKPFGLLFLITRSSVDCLGVPASVLQVELAETLRNRGVREEQISSALRLPVTAVRIA